MTRLSLTFQGKTKRFDRSCHRIWCFNGRHDTQALRIPRLLRSIHLRWWKYGLKTEILTMRYSRHLKYLRLPHKLQPLSMVLQKCNLNPEGDTLSEFGRKHKLELMS